MANTALPQITGTATHKQMLTCSDGLWTNSPTSYTRQWVRCDTNGANCVVIPSATGATYVLSAADVGSSIRCWVSAFNSFGASEAAVTAKTATVAAYVPAIPVNVNLPVVSGTPTEGQTLTTSNGSWTNLPTGYTYQWKRCDAAGANAANISGATTATYVLAAADVGSTIRCAVVAVNTEGSSTAASSAQTAVISAIAVPPPTGLATPANFRITAFTSTSIATAWSAVTGATGYKVAISPASNPTSTTYFTLGAVTSYTFANLSPSTTYQVDVLAFSASMQSGWAGRVSATTLAGAAPAPPPSTTVRFALGTAADMTKSAQVGQSLGVKCMRMFDRTLGMSAAQIVSDCAIYQSRGIRPYILADPGHVGPWPGNIGAWAAAVGRGGTSAHATLPVEWIELGNENFYAYKSGVSIGGAYALHFRTCAQAVAAANPNVKMLFMLDIDGQGAGPEQTLVNNIYSAVPDIHNYVYGWVFHTYGPMTGSNVTKVGRLLNMVAAKGAPSSIGVYITEDGVATDNGVSLTPNNYGWPVNLTYAQSGATLRQKLKDLRANAAWGSRLRLWTNYQAFDQQVPGHDNLRESYFGVVQNNGTTAKGDVTQSVRDHAIAYP